MNPDKWITAGTATLGSDTRLSADAPVTEDAVGRYFAIDEADEYVPGGPKIRRWYLIHGVKINKDGSGKTNRPPFSVNARCFAMIGWA